MTIPAYKARSITEGVMLHASFTFPEQDKLEHLLAVQGRRLGLLEIGYHFLILRDGRLVETRPHTVQGSHCKGKLNRAYIGVCLAGGLGRATCSHCAGSGHALSALWGEPITCPECHGDTVVAEEGDNFMPHQWTTLGHLMDHLGAYYGPLPLVGHSEKHTRHHRQCPPVNMEKAREWISSGVLR